jgi:peptidoglycan hydrolase-like protein with peptidoglycan-binding domain
MSIEREVRQARGYTVGVVDGLYGQNTRRALESFQGDQQLTVTGLPDPETRAKLLP